MIKHIVTSATGTSSDAAVFALAVAVGRRFNAHVEFLYVRPDPAEILMSSVGGDGVFAAGQLLEAVEQDAEAGEMRARAAWSAVRTDEGLICSDESSATCSTAGFEVRIGDEAKWLAEHGRTSDLLVTGRTRRGENVAMGLLHDVLVGTGRPVLLAPLDLPSSLFETVVIAWKSTAEAARAVAGAMPFLTAASEVLVLTVDEEDNAAANKGEAPDMSSERLLRMLRRHGCSVQARHVVSNPQKPVDTLLDTVRACRASLLVMGGYGHSRMRETVFGGFTQRVLRGADIPVLMTH